VGIRSVPAHFLDPRAIWWACPMPRLIEGHALAGESSMTRRFSRRHLRHLKLERGLLCLPCTGSDILLPPRGLSVGGHAQRYTNRAGSLANEPPFRVRAYSKYLVRRDLLFEGWPGPTIRVRLLFGRSQVRSVRERFLARLWDGSLLTLVARIPELRSAHKGRFVIIRILRTSKYKGGDPTSQRGSRMVMLALSLAIRAPTPGAVKRERSPTSSRGDAGWRCPV